MFHYTSTPLFSHIPINTNLVFTNIGEYANVLNRSNTRSEKSFDLWDPAEPDFLWAAGDNVLGGPLKSSHQPRIAGQTALRFST